MRRTKLKCDVCGGPLAPHNGKKGRPRKRHKKCKRKANLARMTLWRMKHPDYWRERKEAQRGSR